MQPTLTVSYFSDVLWLWVYSAQIKPDDLRRQFGDQIRVEYRFLCHVSRLSGIGFP